VIQSAMFFVYMTSEVKTYFHIGLLAVAGIISALLAVAGIISALLADYLVTPGLFRFFRIFGKERKDLEEQTGERLIA